MSAAPGGRRPGHSASPSRRRAGAVATSTATSPVVITVVPDTEAPTLALPSSSPPTSPYKKVAIPRALREQVWIERMGRVFQGKCRTTWCKNTITVFDFHCGHNRPESKGGETALPNLVPLCSRCNLSMNDTYTFDEWCRNFEGTLEPPTTPCYGFVRFFGCLSRNG